MSAVPQHRKVLQLRPPAAVVDEPATQMAIAVRTHLSLLQGYADIMEGLSPTMKRQILTDRAAVRALLLLRRGLAKRVFSPFGTLGVADSGAAIPATYCRTRFT